MKMVPSPPELVELFDHLVPDEPDLQRRTMFGYPCVFINGNLAAGLHAEILMMRLSVADRADFLKLPDAHLFEPMPGRPMKEYVVVPEQLLSDSKQMRKWLDKSAGYVRSLAPKVKK